MKKIVLLFLFVLVASESDAQVPAYLPYGLIAWFPFTGNALDSSGHGHNGTVHGTSMTSGRYGTPNTAFYFNGTSDYIYVPPGLPGADISTDIVSSLTISAWVKSHNYSFTSQEQIYWRGDATPAHDPHMLYIIGSEVKIRRDVDPGTMVNEVGTPVTGLDTNYHMLTGTYDSVTSLMCVYVDGVLMNSAVLPGLETYPTSTMYNYIGAVDGGTWQFFYGAIDELGIWNRALTSCEVAALYYSVPNILIRQPINDTVVAGGTAIFSIRDTSSPTTYQWQEKSGTSFINLTNTPPYSGVYTATLTISPVTTAMSGRQYRCVPLSGSCINDTSSAAKLIVPLPSASQKITAATDIRVIPNPNKGTFTIVSSSFSNQVAIEITDLLGRVVLRRTAMPQSGIINEPVSLANLHSGIYLIKISSAGENKVLRLVIE